MTIQNFGLYINLGNIARATDVCNTTLASTKMEKRMDEWAQWQYIYTRLLLCSANLKMDTFKYRMFWVNG